METWRSSGTHVTNSYPSVLLHVLLRAHLWTQDSWHCFLVHPEVFGHRMLGQIALAAETQGADYIHPLVCNLIFTAPRMHGAGRFAARSMCLLKAEQILWPATSQDFLCISLIWSWWLFCLVWEIFVFFFSLQMYLQILKQEPDSMTAYQGCL